jgi:WD40-like Beta Propeller Repeat
VLVPELVASGYSDFKETLTADMLEMYFISDRPGGPGNQDVWHAKRARVTDPWGTPNCVLEVSSPLHEAGPAVAPDGLTLWVSSDRAGGKGGYDIWVSTRPDTAAVWSTPRPVTELNTVSDEFPRPPIQSGLVMPPSYREKLPNNQFQTFLTSRASANTPWAAPTRLTEVDTSNIDTDGFLTDDELVLYFSTDRAIVGDQDLYVARRSSPQSPFTSFVPIAELNTTRQERDPWVSRDGREIYFSSDRSGTLQIYHATR